MPSHVQDGSTPATEVRQQVDRILRSGEFSGSEVLRNLLSFLTKRSIEKPGEVVKEYELAVGVLRRAEGFDPRLDSAVRVHTARLRAKLAEYYMSDGAGDPILIEVPKGSYHLAWRYRGGESAAPVEPPKEAVAPHPAGSISWKWFTAGFLAALALAGIGISLWVKAAPAKVAPVVKTFWQPFLQSSQPPIIVFSNHRFAGSRSESVV